MYRPTTYLATYSPRYLLCPPSPYSTNHSLHARPLAVQRQQRSAALGGRGDVASLKYVHMYRGPSNCRDGELLPRGDHKDDDDALGRSRGCSMCRGLKQR